MLQIYCILKSPQKKFPSNFNSEGEMWVKWGPDVYNGCFSCNQAALCMVQSLSVCPSFHLSVCPSVFYTFFTMFPSSYHNENFRSYYQWWTVTCMQNIKVRGQRSRSQRSKPNIAVSGPQLQFEFTYDDEMMHRAWCSLGEVPYCFSKSSVKFQGHTAKKIVDFDPDLGVFGL